MACIKWPVRWAVEVTFAAVSVQSSGKHQHHTTLFQLCASCNSIYHRQHLTSMSLSTRSPVLLALQALVLCTVLLLLTTGPLTPVEAGKKEKMLLGLAVGHAISNRAREHSLIRLIIPLRMAAEAWKHFGHATAHEHGGYEHFGHHGHEHYGGHHHHLGHLHIDEHYGGHHLKA